MSGNYIDLGSLNFKNENGFSIETYLKFTSDNFDTCFFTLSFDKYRSNDLSIIGKSTPFSDTYESFPGIDVSHIDKDDLINIIEINESDFKFQKNIWYHLILNVDSSSNGTIIINGTQIKQSTIGQIKDDSVRTKCYLGISTEAAELDTTVKNYPQMNVKFFRIYDNSLSNEQIDLIYTLKNNKLLFKPYIEDTVFKLNNKFKSVVNQVRDPTYAFDFRFYNGKVSFDYLSGLPVHYKNVYSDYTGCKFSDLLDTSVNYPSSDLNLPASLTFSPNLQTTNNSFSIELFTHFYSNSITTNYRNYIFDLTNQDQNGAITSKIEFFQSNTGIGVGLLGSDNNYQIIFDGFNYDIFKNNNLENKMLHIALVFSNTSDNNSLLKIYVTDETYWNTNKSVNKIVEKTIDIDLSILNGTYNNSFIGNKNPINLSASNYTGNTQGKKMDLKYFRIYNNTSLTESELNSLYLFKDDDRIYEIKKVFTPNDDLEFKSALFLYFDRSEFSSYHRFGKLKNWDTKNVTDMSYLTDYLSLSDDAVSKFNTESEIDINTYFQKNYGIDFNNVLIHKNEIADYVSNYFNEDLKNWNTTNVTNMKYMFSGAKNFNSDITKKIHMPYGDLDNTLIEFSNEEGTHTAWDLSSVQDFSYMFSGCESFNTNITTWQFDLNADLTNIFENATLFNNTFKDHYNFNVSPDFYFFNKVPILDIDLYSNVSIHYSNDQNSIEYIDSINSYGKIQHWDTSKITNLNKLFEKKNINFDITNWDVSNVQNFNGLFKDSINFNQDISNWNVSSSTSMNSMFLNCTDFNQDISNWNVENCKDFASTFKNTSFNCNLSSWNVENAENFSSMFENTPFNQPLNDWQMNKIKEISKMFKNCTKFNQPLDKWYDKMSNVKNFHGLFYGNKEFNQDLSSWITLSATRMDEMFYDCHKFNSVLNTWDVFSVENFSNMFYNNYLFDQDISNWTTGFFATNFSGMFYNCHKFNSPLGDWDVSKVQDFSNMFHNNHLFNQDISNWLTLSAVNLRGMFFGCSIYDQPMSNWELSNATDISSMFNGANLFNQDLSSWNISNVTNISNIFQNAFEFNGDIQNWNVSNVLLMNSVFQNARKFNGIITNWDVGNVLQMNYMFYNAKLFNQNLNSFWDFTNVISYIGMFQNASSFDQDIKFKNINTNAIFFMMFKGATKILENYSNTIDNLGTPDYEAILNIGIDSPL